MPVTLASYHSNTSEPKVLAYDLALAIQAPVGFIISAKGFEYHVMSADRIGIRRFAICSKGLTRSISVRPNAL